MSNELANLQPKEVTLNTVQIAQYMGELAFKSGIYKVSKPEAAAMIMLKGYELGFPMTASADFITLIEGTVGLTPRGAMAIMQSHPEIIKSVDVTDIEKDGKYYGCKCEIVRIKNGTEHKYTKTFTMDDAQKAELIKPKSGWEKYPQQMCQWRALGFAADLACPDLLAGLTGLLKQPELTAEGGVDAIAYTEQTEPQAEVIDAEPQITLNELISKYGAENIMAVNNNAIPRNNEECAKIYEILKAKMG